MNKLILNIGLNVNGVENYRQLSKTLEKISEYFDVSDLRIDNSNETNSDWKVERVLIVEAAPYIIEPSNVLKHLAEKLNQDAIAYKYNGEGNIVFSKTYIGEKFQFNNQYFKTI